MKIAVCIALMLLAITASGNARPSLAFEPDIPTSNFVSNVPTTKSSRRRARAPDQIALKFVKDELGLAGADVVVKNIVPSSATGITSVYLRQKVNGIEVINADVNVNVDKYVPILMILIEVST